MKCYWIRNDIGEPKQTTFIDPLGKSGFMHEGRSVDELKRDGYVGIYVLAENYKSTK